MDEHGEASGGFWGETRRMCGALQISPNIPPAIRDCFASLDFVFLFKFRDDRALNSQSLPSFLGPWGL